MTVFRVHVIWIEYGLKSAYETDTIPHPVFRSRYYYGDSEIMAVMKTQQMVFPDSHYHLGPEMVRPGLWLLVLNPGTEKKTAAIFLSHPEGP